MKTVTRKKHSFLTALILVAMICFTAGAYSEEASAYKDEITKLKQAAEKDDARAKGILSLLFQCKMSNEIDADTAKAFAESSSKNNSPFGDLALAVLLMPSQEYREQEGKAAASAQKLKPLADGPNRYDLGKGGDLWAQFILGLCYAELCSSMTDEGWKAIEYYKTAAKQGFAPAQFSLGKHFYNGRADGEGRDYKEAAKFFRLSAEQGFAPAQNALGNFYSNGIGVEKNINEGFKWHQKSAEQGNEKGQYSLGKR